MRKTIIAAAAGLAAVAGATGAALAAGGSGGPASRLDDGKELLPQASISEQEAIAAAQRSVGGALDEVDLEHYKGRLVFNVDVGRHDVKVDAADGTVLGSPVDDPPGSDD